MIVREDYLNKIKPFINTPLVKILTGIRRCGKSTILEMIKQELLNNGVKDSNIITKRFTSMQNITTAQEIYDEIKGKIDNKSKFYLMLDEVQEVDNWEKLVNSLLEDFDTDIYITGSNSKLMSSEISTYLSGRYVLIPVFTLSFKEYLKFKNNNFTNSENLKNYIRFGGFPLVALGSYDEQTTYQIVDGIYTSVITKDIATRHEIKNQDLFNRVVKFIVENVGKTFSANSIVQFLKSEKRSLTIETIYNYLNWLEKAFIIYRCSRYDLQGKSVLKTQEKFYLADQTLKYCIMGYNEKSVSSMLENIVYFELLRRGYNVYIGKNFEKEIDFVAIKRDERFYIQVCRELPKNSDRELQNLLEIKDHYQKMIVTLDEYTGGNVEGVKFLNLADFLLSDKY